MTTINGRSTRPLSFEYEDQPRFEPADRVAFIKATADTSRGGPTRYGSPSRLSHQFYRSDTHGSISQEGPQDHQEVLR